jgi:uncharacterized protein (TIGR02147 family)
MNCPNILDHENYRAYLKDWYIWMKETKSGFSYRTFSKWAGFKSPNQLLLIIGGKRNITAQTMGIFTKILKLKRRERHYFEILVNMNQADTPEAKANYIVEMANYFKKYKNNLKQSQYDYLTKWYYPVIREMVTTKWFKNDRRMLSRRIGHRVSPMNVDEAIEKLFSLGLISKDANGDLKQAEAVVSTGAETQAAASYFYHDQMMRLALDALRKQMPNERNFSAITLACRKEDIQEIAQILNDCRRQILTYLEARGKVKDDDVYQLNLQLFRVTNDKGGKEGGHEEIN